MKKFSLLFAVTTIAVFSQAAQVDWSLSSGNLSAALNAIGADANDVTAYYYVLGETNDSGFTVGSLTANEQLAIYDKYKGETPTATSQAVSRGGTIGTSWTPEDTNLIGDPNSQYVVVIYEATGSDDNTYALASVAHYVKSGSEEFDDYTADRTSAIGSNAYDSFTASSGGQWTQVPEPTTVALLALGLAVVGLKRKVA